MVFPSSAASKITKQVCQAGFKYPEAYGYQRKVYIYCKN